MTKFIAVISGKGGVGKTTVSVNLATALISLGRRTVLLDADLHTPNVGLQLGTPLLPKTSYDALEGVGSIRDVAYRHISGLNVIPAKLYPKKLSNDHFVRLSTRLRDLDDSAELVLVDMPSGLSEDLRVVLKKCDYSLIVTTPDFPSLANALKAIRVSEETGTALLGVVVNMTKDDSFEMGKDEIEALLGQRVLVMVPDEQAIRESIYLRNPVVYSHPDSVPAERFRKLAMKFIT